MPRFDRHEPPPSDRRRGPYEAAYELVRGYDVPPPPSRRASDRRPVMLAARRDDSPILHPYG